jgi:diguanylate cyclase (GGDEF)-like protein/PAS domain S-box-containing protein
MDAPVHALTAPPAGGSPAAPADISRSMLDALADHICVLDQSGRVVAVNAAWLQFARENGGPADGGEGCNYLDVCADAERCGDADAKAVATGIAAIVDGRSDGFRHRYPCHGPDVQRWFVLSATRAPAPGPVHVVLAHSDVTARTLAEARARRIDRLYRALSETNAAIAQLSDRDALLQAVCDIAVRVGDFKVAAVRLVDQGDSALRPMVSSGDDRGYLDAAYQVFNPADASAMGPTTAAVRAGRAAVHNDFAAEPSLRPWHELAAEHGIRAHATFPLTVDGAVAGGFSLYAAARGYFDGELVDLLAQMADNLSLALENVAKESRRRAAESDLRASEARYRALSELSADYYWDTDEQHRFIGIWSRAGTGPISPPGAYLGRTRWEMARIVNVSDTEWAAHRQTLDARQPFRDFVLAHLDAEGDAVWFAVSGHPVFDGNGTFTGYRGISRDVTAGKRDEQLLVLEHKVTTGLAADDDAQAALRMVLQVICETEGWDCCRYLDTDEGGGLLRTTALWSVADPAVEAFVEAHRDASFAPGAGLAGRVWESGLPIWTVDLPNDSRVVNRTAAAAAGMRAALLFPVIALGRTRGVLVFNSRKGRVPDARLQQALLMIGNQVGQFLQRKEAESSTYRFRAAMDLIADSVLLVDRQSMRYIDVNDGACRMLGYTRAELLALGPDEVTTLGRAELESVFDSLINGKVDTSTQRHRHRDGRLIPVEISFAAVHSDGRWILVGVARDITQRLADQEALRVSSERFDLVTRATSDVIWDWDLRTGAHWWNPNFERAFGHAPQEAVSGIASWSDHIHPDDRDATLRDLEAAIQGRDDLWSDEYRFRRSDGEYAHVYDRCYISRDSGGAAVRMIGAMFDLTEQKNAEDALKLLARRDRLLADLGRMALAAGDPESVMLHAAEVLRETLDFDLCKVLEVTPDGQGLVLRAAIGWPAALVGRQVMTMTAGDEVSYAFSDVDPVLVEDFARETRFAASAFLRAQGVVCGIMVAIPGRDAPYGVIGVYASTQIPVFEADAVFLRAVANLLGSALQRQRTERQLAYLAQFDALTGLANRQLFRDRLTQTIAHAHRSGGGAAVLYVNVGNFSLINDTYGQAGGDRLLVDISQRLARSVGGGDTLSRLGGDEFAIAMACQDNTDDATAAAQKVVAAFAEPFACADETVFVSAGIGIAIWPGDSDNADGLLKEAAIAMYRAKLRGATNYQFYTPGMNQVAEQRLRLEGQLRQAQERGEFLLHFQPKVDLASGRIAGAEALLRWRHPERGLVSPAEFIGVLEDTGLIVPVGLWVLRNACEQLAAWQVQGLAVPGIAVNLSARQFQHDDFVEQAAQIVAAAGIDPHRIELEITESMLMSDPEHAVGTLTRLKQAGFRLALDDFGTGYSSLSRLQRFPLNTLKIDRAFVGDIATDPDDAAIALAIINLAHNLQLNVVAEGVETRPQLIFLVRLGCDQMQGFLFSQPVEADAFARMFAGDKVLDVRARSVPKGHTVLLLDDSAFDLELLQEAIAEEGYELLSARSAKQAFELLATNDVQMIVSDHHMPEMSGVELLSRVKQLYPLMTRVMVTGTANADDISAAINGASIHNFISKGWSAERIRTTLRHAMRRVDARYLASVSPAP